MQNESCQNHVYPKTTVIGLGVVRIWCCLRGNATTATCDDTGDAHVVLGVVIREPQLLVMSVTSDQQVKAHVGQRFIETLFMATREVSDCNLPSSLALGQQLTDPIFLLGP